MAGGPEDPALAAKFTGFRKYYNSQTAQGRAGAAKITMGAMLLGLIYLKLKPAKKQ